jgi:hypothetical protein
MHGSHPARTLQGRSGWRRTRSSTGAAAPASSAEDRLRVRQAQRPGTPLVGGACGVFWEGCGGPRARPRNFAARLVDPRLQVVFLGREVTVEGARRRCRPTSAISSTVSLAESPCLQTVRARIASKLPALRKLGALDPELRSRANEPAGVLICHEWALICKT